MGAMSKTAEKCLKCRKIDKCNHKYMEACAYINEEENELANTGKSAGMPAGQPCLRETMQINIGGVMTTVYKDEIEKEIYKALNESFCIGLNYGA